MSEEESNAPFFRVPVNIYVTAKDGEDARHIVHEMMLGNERMSKNWNTSKGEKL
jgi:hypothetical protein